MQLVEQDVELEETFVPEPEEEQDDSHWTLRTTSIWTFVCFAIGFGALLTIIWTFTDPDYFIAVIANEGGSIGTGLPNNAVFRVRGLWGIRAVAAVLIAMMTGMVVSGISNIIDMTARKALAKAIIAGVILGAGVFAFQLPWDQPSVPQATASPWPAATRLAVAPAGAAAEALVGTWAFGGRPWYQFNADGTGMNLSDGEQFNWHEDGTFSNATVYQNWVIEDDVLTITWVAGSTFQYSRITS
jgi:hypothetical protein